mgnify:CR=1 FL=1
MHNNGKFKHKHKFYHKFKKNKKNNNTGAMKDNTIDDYYKCLNIAKEESSIFEIDLNIFEKDKETIQNDLNIDYKVDLSKENENLITNKEDNQHPSLETNIKKTDGKQNILRKTNYLSFNTRLIINIILLIFVLILTLYFSILSSSSKLLYFVISIAFIKVIES